MRLILSARSRTLLDVEILVFPRPSAPDNGPTLRATGGIHAERAETYGDPATVTSFGFSARRA